MATEGTIHFYPRKWPAFTPLVMAIILFLFYSPQNKDATVAIICIMLVISSGYILLLRLRRELIINDDGITFKTWFNKDHINWKDLSKTYISYWHHGKAAQSFWYFEAANGNKLRFPLRQYPRNVLQVIANTVMARRKNAIADDWVMAMAKGHFPWYTF
ncbi:MAG TPA: DUF6585 family protein [Flavisolibacter sp.]|nr:DUF6585 family protein [Flavisolibacter sp.]